MIPVLAQIEPASHVSGRLARFHVGNERSATRVPAAYIENAGDYARGESEYSDNRLANVNAVKVQNGVAVSY